MAGYVTGDIDDAYLSQLEEEKRLAKEADKRRKAEED